MGVLEKLEESMATQDEKTEMHAAGTIPAPEDGIRAFDEQGRQVMVPREAWRSNVIPGMVEQAWNDPEQLYLVILNSLNDGFVQEMTDAASHLNEIDTIPGRGATMWGIVLMNTGRLVEAEALLSGFELKHAPDASVLVNLAKVYAEQGAADRSVETLERALEIEPNHENGLGWYASMEQQRGGGAAARAVLERIAAKPNAWRAHLWLGRGELNAGNVAVAMNFYRQALSRAPAPAPPDLLMQMSGDLGAKGLLRELIELTMPSFVPEVHGLPIGNNLIKALADSGDLNAAEQVKASLWAQNRPEWKEALASWDGEIARRRLSGVPMPEGQTPPQQLQVGMLQVDGPIWLPPGSPSRTLFGMKSPAAPKVTFLGGSAEGPEMPAGTEPKMDDRLGQMTRSLPLFLAEQVEMRTAAAARTMIPWAVAPVSGFVVSGQRWPDQTAVEAMQAPEHASEYAVTVHVDAEVEPWVVMLAFIRISDGKRIGELECDFSVSDPEQALSKLADEMVELLSVLGPATKPATYAVPEGAAFESYLSSLEQLLAVRCAGMDGMRSNFLGGEREMVESQISLCRAESQNVPARLLLQCTLSGLDKSNPEIVEAVRRELEQLSKEHPIIGINLVAG